MGADGGLEEWAAGSGRRRPGGWPRGYLLFAFYGRVSTEDWQDPASSWPGSGSRLGRWCAGKDRSRRSSSTLGRAGAWPGLGGRRPPPWSPSWPIPAGAGRPS